MKDMVPFGGHVVSGAARGKSKDGLRRGFDSGLGRMLVTWRAAKGCVQSMGTVSMPYLGRRGLWVGGVHAGDL